MNAPIRIVNREVVDILTTKIGGKVIRSHSVKVSRKDVIQYKEGNKWVDVPVIVV